MTVHQITGAQPAREATDSELAASWAAECLTSGRIELGAALARLAAQADRVERSQRVRNVPVLGATRDEAPRPAVEPTPIHDGALYAHHEPVSGPTGNGDADLARERAELAQTAVFGPVTEPVLDVPPTRHCRATIMRDGVRDTCHGVLYWEAGTTGDATTAPTSAGWRHVHPNLEQDHPPYLG